MTDRCGPSTQARRTRCLRRPRARSVVMDPLRVVAAGEAATGLALTLFPQVVVQLLFGVDAAGAGLAMARIAGMALLALGIACWPEAGASGGARAPAPRYWSTARWPRSTWVHWRWTASSAARCCGLPSSFMWWSPWSWPRRGPHRLARHYEPGSKDRDPRATE